MNEILTGVVTGVVTASLLGAMAWGDRKIREWRRKQLGELLEEIIKHRNAGRRSVSDPAAWVRKAKEFEKEAERRARKISSASAALIHSLGNLEPYIIDDKVVKDPEQARYIGILTTLISRIQDTLARHDR